VTALVFPDNTVLINLAYLNALPLIRLRDAKVTWCASVAQECRRSSDLPDLQALKTAPSILGKPLYPQGAEHTDIQTIRHNMLAPGDSPTAHLGEAETIAIITRRNIRAVFVTDDREATTVAQTHGIIVVSTWGLLRIAVKLYLISKEDFWHYCQTLDAKSRGWPPCGHSRTDVDAWLEQP
jgi:predicted nucleic acid-binding protein